MDVKIKPPRWPNYVFIDARLEGDPKMSVGKLSADEIEKLCESLREHCKKKAKLKPATGAEEK